jgi:hypothetical protein
MKMEIQYEPYHQPPVRPRHKPQDQDQPGSEPDQRRILISPKV